MCNPIFSTIPTGPNKIPPFTFPSHVCRAKVNDVLVPGYMYSMATAHIVECHVPYCKYYMQIRPLKIQEKSMILKYFYLKIWE